MWGYGVVVHAPDGAIWKVATRRLPRKAPGRIASRSAAMPARSPPPDGSAWEAVPVRVGSPVAE